MSQPEEDRIAAHSERIKAEAANIEMPQAPRQADEEDEDFSLDLDSVDLARYAAVDVKELQEAAAWGTSAITQELIGYLEVLRDSSCRAVDSHEGRNAGFCAMGRFQAAGLILSWVKEQVTKHANP